MTRAEDGTTVRAGFYDQLGPGIYRGADGQLHKLPPVTRELATAARQYADQTTERLSAAATSKEILGTIKSVTAGGARDGNALVTLTWRGQEVTCAGYAAHYTPAVGHRVVAAYIDNQLIVLGRVVGQP